MKRLFCFVLVLVFAVSLLPQMEVSAAAATGTPDTSWYNTINTTFTISTADQLAGLAQLVNNGNDNFSGKTIRLSADIDISPYGEGWNDGKGWTPIGTRDDADIAKSKPFKGVFDGDSHTITGLYINNGTLGSTGLIGHITDGVVMNFGVVDAVITGGSFYVGGVVGFANNTTLSDCYFTGVVKSTSRLDGSAGMYVGGMVGFLGKDSHVKNCYSKCAVSGKAEVGGVVGATAYSCSVTNCYATGVVYGGLNGTGGVVGVVDTGSVENCYATNTVNGDSNVGGVVGYINNSGNVTNCYATGAINGKSSIGGIVGFIGELGGSNNNSVTNCVAVNPSVAGDSGMGRVAGYNMGVLLGNYTFEGLKDKNGVTTSWINKTHNGIDGEDLKNETALTATFWTTTPNWQTSGWSTAVWDIIDGKLPALKNMPANVPWELPSHKNVPSRIAGNSAIDTAVEISKQTGWSGTAILASSESYGMADALAVGPLAFSLKVPILLTENRAALNAATKAELTRLHVNTVYVTSGTSVIPQSVLDEIAAMDITVVPLGGRNRAETSVNMAKRMTGVTKVAVVNSIPDALSIAPIASAANQPILLVDIDDVPGSITDYLSDAGIHSADIIGGTGVISNATAGKFPNAQRHFGNTAYDTNNQVIQYFALQLSFNLVYVANGETAIDALSGVPLAAMTNSPFVLTDNKTVPAAASFIFGKLDADSQWTALGGIAVVSESIYTEIKQGNVGNPGGSDPGSGNSNGSNLGSENSSGENSGSNSSELTVTNIE